MKKLICLRDVEEAFSNGKNSIYIGKDTIITPSAKDFAKFKNIKFETETILDFSSFETEKIYNILKVIVGSGLLNCENDNYNYKKDDLSGFKIIDGLSINNEKSEVKDKVYITQEVIHEDESSLLSGYILLENNLVNENYKKSRNICVINGELKVKINEKTFLAKEGDSLFIPKETDVHLSSNKKTRLFYSEVI